MDDDIKMHATYSLHRRLVGAVRDRARELDVPASSLVDLGLRLLLSKPAELECWAEARHEEARKAAAVQTPTGKPAGRRDRLEAAILDALKPPDARCWAVPFQAVASKAGELQKHVFPVLVRLEAAGKVGSMTSSQEDDWGRPRESYWWLTSAVNRVGFPDERPEELPDEGGHLPLHVWCHLGPAVEMDTEYFYALEQVRLEIKEWTKSQNRATRRVQAQVRGLVRAALGLADQHQRLHFTTAPDYVPGKGDVDL